MTRYIDADALMEKSFEIECADGWHKSVTKEVVSVGDIDNAPIIDVVEVVRCGDCKYGSEDYPKDIFPDVTKETYSCDHSTYSHDKDFYCKYGERNTNE